MDDRRQTAGRLDAMSPPRRPCSPFVLALGLLLALGACGGPDAKPDAAAKKRPQARSSWMPGIDKNEALGEGPFFRKTVVTRAYDLEPWLVNFHAEPFRVKPFSRTEDVYITRWRSNTEEPDGTRSPDDIHCHTYMADSFPRQVDAWLFTGIYTDGFTPVFELPEGFGIRVPKGQAFKFLPMFNNRRAEQRKARMRLEVDYAPVSALPDMTSLSAFTVSSARPDTYWIQPREPGTEFYRDVKAREITMPTGGRVHAIGAHLHPYGRSVELKRVRDDKVMFTAVMIEAAELEHQRLTTYQSKEGFYVRRGERYVVTTIYENTTDEKIDAMGGLFLFYDPDGTPD